MTAARNFIGIDENGLGPRLGPLIVTAVMARVSPLAEPILSRKPRAGLAKRLGDSKGLVAHGDCALGEAWTRVLVAKGAGKRDQAADPDELLDAVSLDGRALLTSPCPSHAHAQCWHLEADTINDPEPVAALGKTLKRDLARLQKRGVDVVAVRSVITCTRELNEAAEQGQSRLLVDLHSMERLILALREIAGCEIQAVCGKVGGYGQYSKAFGPLGGRLHAVIEQTRRRSAYHFPGLGQIAFEMDCDANNILVAMASLVGKYLRELLMGRIVGHYRRDDPSLPLASGYHDPVTARFVEATAAARTAQRIPLTCFERIKAAGRARE